MRKEDVLDLVRQGEDSGLEFKLDDVANHDLAKELVAFLNFEGGTVLLGVADDGRIAGAARPRLEEWVAELCRTKIEPPVIPHLSWARDLAGGADVLAIRLPMGPDKPYARVHHGRRTYYVRVGSTSNEASRDELERMFQATGRIQYGLKPVPGSSLEGLDQRRLRDYFERVLRGTLDEEPDRLERLLSNLDLMVLSGGAVVPTIDAMLLFGKNPKRFLPQSGVRALCYVGTKPDYATRADEILRGPLLPLCAADGAIVESGLVEQALDFVRRNTQPEARIEGGRRIDRPAYPPEVLREAIVNALVHRDYSIAGADVGLTIYADRLEIASPGRLPNTVSVEGMKAGLRYARNQTLVNILRDYRYVDFRGMGIRDKIIPGMRAHNGTDPDLIAESTRFTVRLWIDPSRPAQRDVRDIAGTWVEDPAFDAAIADQDRIDEDLRL